RSRAIIHKDERGSCSTESSATFSRQHVIAHRLLGRGASFQPSLTDCRSSRFVFPGLDGLHRERTDADPHRALDRPSAPPATLPWSRSAHLHVPHDHLHLRNLGPILSKLNAPCTKPLLL